MVPKDSLLFSNFEMSQRWWFHGKTNLTDMLESFQMCGLRQLVDLLQPTKSNWLYSQPKVSYHSTENNILRKNKQYWEKYYRLVSCSQKAILHICKPTISLFSLSYIHHRCTEALYNLYIKLWAEIICHQMKSLKYYWCAFFWSDEEHILVYALVYATCKLLGIVPMLFNLNNVHQPAAVMLCFEIWLHD